MKRLQHCSLIGVFFLCTSAFAVGSDPEASRLAKENESESSSAPQFISDLKLGKQIKFNEGTEVTAQPSEVKGTRCLVHLESKGETKKVKIFKAIQWEVQSVKKTADNKTELHLTTGRVFINKIVVVCPADEKLSLLEPALFSLINAKTAETAELNMGETEIDRAAKGRWPRDWDKPRPGSTKGGSR